MYREIKGCDHESLPVLGRCGERPRWLLRFCPEIQGCYTQGATYEEALQNLKDAIRLHVEDRIQAGEEIPQPESISLTSLEVAV